MHAKTALVAGVLAGALALSGPALAGDNGQASPRKVDGSWLSLTTIDQSEYIDPPDGWPLIVPELDSFSSDGVIITTGAVPYMQLKDIPGFPPGTFWVAVSTGHGSWRWNGKDGIVITEYRSLSDPLYGELLGWAKIYVQLEFTTPDTLHGPFFVEMLDKEGNPTGITITGVTDSVRIAPEKIPVP